MSETQPGSRRRVGRWILRAAAVLLLAAGIYYWRNHTGLNGLRFDRDRWLAFEQDESGYSTRWNMVGDLRRRHLLVGMTRREVEALLGPATYKSVNDLYPYPGWDLGMHPSPLSTDSTALPIQFGPDGRVVKVWGPGR